MPKTVKSRRSVKGILIDREFQGPFVLGMLTVFSLVTLMFWFACTSADVTAFEGLQGDEVKRLILRLLTAFFVVNAAAATVFLCVNTHRVAGPLKVLDEAVLGMTEGDYSLRTKTRKTDFFQPFSSHLGTLQETLRDQAEARSTRDQELLELLQSGNVSDAETHLRLTLEEEREMIDSTGEQATSTSAHSGE